MAYLEPKASSKACRTCKMIMHIQSPNIVKTVHLNIFKDIDAYSGTITEQKQDGRKSQKAGPTLEK